MTRLKIQITVTCIAVALTVTAALAYDLEKPRDLLDAYVKTVGDLSGEESLTYASVVVMSFPPGERGRKLFGLDVLGASRYLKTADGYQRLHREVGLYTNLETGEVMGTWSNPLNGREVEVIHIQNDPVNFPYTVEQQSGERRVRYDDFGDQIAFHREVMLRYPSAMPRADYPLHSQKDFYEAGELFNSFVSRADLEDPSTTKAPEFGSWSRVGPWLPWMEMGDRPGILVYHGRSAKLMNGLEGVPEPVLDYIRKHMPKYLHAPDEFESPNETSWTYFKKVIDEKRESGEKQ